MVDARRKEGLTSAVRKELVELRRRSLGPGDGTGDPQARECVFRQGEHPPKTVIRLVLELASDGFPVAVTCRVLEVAPSTYFEAIKRQLSARTVEDQELTGLIVEVHEDSRGTYGAPRVHTELRMGMGLRIGRKRVARLMRAADIHGVSHRRKRRHRPDTATHDDLVKRQFTADGPDRVWFTDITQHRASDGWVYCCAVVDAWSRRIVGWSIADHMRSELVVDALEMARWQRSPEGTIVHADRGGQYTSWAFGHRLQAVGLLGSMRRVASSVDNALIESFWSTMQRELLDRQHWGSRVELASAIFEWIEGCYNPRRRHSTLGMLSPHEYETLHTAAQKAACSPNRYCPDYPGPAPFSLSSLYKVRVYVASNGSVIGQMNTKTKIRLASLAYGIVSGFRKLFGLGSRIVVRRGKLTWDLDISEGIDFSIYILGGFEKNTIKFYEDLIKKSHSQIIIDIGANCGSHSLPLARMVTDQKHARVFALEPAGFAYERLQRNLALNPGLSGILIPRQILIWDGSVANVPTSTYASWPLGAVNRESTLHSVHQGALHDLRGSRVMTLDEFVKAERLPSVDLLKIDVDGYEVQVLQGSVETISSCHPTIVLEWAPHLIDSGELSLETLLSRLTDLGYSLSLVETGTAMKYDLESLKRRIPTGGSKNLVLTWTNPNLASLTRD